jgi:hypothetical protein
METLAPEAIRTCDVPPAGTERKGRHEAAPHVQLSAVYLLGSNKTNPRSSGGARPRAAPETR